MFEKNINLIDFQTIFVTLVVCGVSFLRVIPHVYNFSPVIALAIFGAIHYKHRKLAYLVPLISILFSDIIINNFVYNLSNNIVIFYKGFYWQYISYAIIIFLSLKYNHKKINIKNISFLVISTSTLFFVTTNFGYWLTSGLYTHNISGLFKCYVNAIPFFEGTLLGTIFYTPIFIGLYYFLQRKITYLQSKHLYY